ncbi:MAG: hypothetical protein WC481_07500 [Candidatus Omnitrophota bacterium]
MDNHRTATVYIPDYDGELFVVFSFYPGSPGRMYLRNGDPGFPDEPSEIEIISVSTSKDSFDIFGILSDKSLEDIEEACALEAEAPGEWDE